MASSHLPSAHAIEQAALKDYERHLWRVVVVKAILGHRDNESVDISLERPALVRVLPTDRESVIRWMDEWLDPVWDVELVESHPELAGLESPWVYATSYSIGEDPKPGDILGFWPLSVTSQAADAADEQDHSLGL